MKRFAHYNARSVEEAVFALKRHGNGSLIAGGTDLLGRMKDEILPAYPEAVINLKTIPGLDFMDEGEGVLRIGALTRLEDIANSAVILSRYKALADAAHKTASPHIREMGTLGGNICQDIRCWYYRSPHNRFPCLRKGGGRCYAIQGDNRYHSIFGSTVRGGCLAVHPSDTAPALIALDSSLKTTQRTIRVEEFFDVGVTKTTVLEPGEIVLEARVPEPSKGSRSCFLKFAARKSIDFPIVNCAAMVALSGTKISGARICLNAVYLTPYRAVKAEEALLGREIDEESAETAGQAAVTDAKPLRYNRYMVQIAKTLVKRAVLGCRPID
jgi:xanthine dehydrogenase YagS FAD-binding subunit